MKILLAVDDSKYSQAAIQSMLQRAHPPDTEVRVLHVLEPILEAQWSSQPCLRRNDGAAAPGSYRDGETRGRVA